MIERYHQIRIYIFHKNVEKTEMLLQWYNFVAVPVEQCNWSKRKFHEYHRNLDLFHECQKNYGFSSVPQESKKNYDIHWNFLLVKRFSLQVYLSILFSLLTLGRCNSFVQSWFTKKNISINDIYQLQTEYICLF